MSSAVSFHHNSIKPSGVKKMEHYATCYKSEYRNRWKMIPCPLRTRLFPLIHIQYIKSFLSQDRMRWKCVSSQGTEHPLGCNLDVFICTDLLPCLLYLWLNTVALLTLGVWGGGTQEDGIYISLQKEIQSAWSQFVSGCICSHTGRTFTRAPGDCLAGRCSSWVSCSCMLDSIKSLRLQL